MSQRADPVAWAQLRKPVYAPGEITALRTRLLAALAGAGTA